MNITAENEGKIGQYRFNDGQISLCIKEFEVLNLHAGMLYQPALWAHGNAYEVAFEIFNSEALKVKKDLLLQQIDLAVAGLSSELTENSDNFAIDLV